MHDTNPLFNNDPWRVLAYGILTGLSKEEKAFPVLEEFFEKWPTAKSCVIGNIEEQARVIGKLGMAHRADYIKAAAKQWVIWCGYKGLPEDFQVEKLKGCGPYVRKQWDTRVLGKCEG